MFSKLMVNYFIYRKLTLLTNSYINTNHLFHFPLLSVNVRNQFFLRPLRECEAPVGKNPGSC